MVEWRYKMINRRCINIACGDSYVVNWRNYDYAPHSDAVIKTDLLRRLPEQDLSADVIYSSHFFEHIPRNCVQDFINECFRVCNHNGWLRLVLPDLEELCKSYLLEVESGNHEKAKFIVLEMIDQCVRKSPGGELGEYYKRLQSTTHDTNDMKGYIKLRTGHDLSLVEEEPKFKSKYTALLSPQKIISWIEKQYCRLIVRLLPRAFRHQNVSFASVGEQHAWIYDFYMVEQILKQAGFVNIRRMSANTSNITEFPFFPLDVNKDGQLRKGKESMYIEAMKP